MGSDDLFSKHKGQRKIRKENNRKLEPYRYLIVCEGKQTEVNYFTGIKNRIEQHYSNKIDVRKPEMYIQGTGRNTEDLVQYAIRLRNQSEIPYGHTWVVFDKDDFTDKQFNNAIQEANLNHVAAAWSNEAFELWFILHFEYLNARIPRHQYNQKLNAYFSQHSINGGKYEKNYSEIFETLCQNGSLSNALRWSKLLKEELWSNKKCTESEMNPCTTVDDLVSEFLPYIEEE